MIPIPDAEPGRLLPDLDTTARAAVITGDADRVDTFAKAVGEVTASWRFRELEIREVSTGTDKVLVASHGMGGPGAALLTEELIDSGVTTVVRVGTCGPLQASLEPAVAVVSTGVVRDDGTSSQYLPPGVPAVPDLGLVTTLGRGLRAEGVPYLTGLTHCKDAYYSQAPERLAAGGDWRARWRQLRDLGVLCTEGEAGALFAVATVRRVRAAAVLVVGGAAPHAGLDRLTACAVSAAGAALAPAPTAGEVR